jgi:hypothetical protein
MTLSKLSIALTPPITISGKVIDGLALSAEDPVT